MQPLLATEGLNFSVGRESLVHGVGLEVDAGQVYGLLGLNGAGKTTCLKLITGLLRPDSGTIRFRGQVVQCADQRAGLAAVVEAPAFVPALAGADNVLYSARLHGQCDSATAAQELRRMGLDPTDRRPVRTWSLGMKQRLALAMALATRPQLLLLDEPTNGLDPAGIADLRALLPRLARDEGTAVLLSSHLLDEVEHCCTHVGVLRSGRLLMQSPLHSLRERAGWKVRLTGSAAPPETRCREALARCRAALPSEHWRADADDTLHLARGTLPAEEVLARLVAAGVPVCAFEPASRLEDVLLGRTEDAA